MHLRLKVPLLYKSLHRHLMLVSQVYHCDSMFSEGKEESWVKLITVGQVTNHLWSLKLISDHNGHLSSHMILVLFIELNTHCDIAQLSPSFPILTLFMNISTVPQESPSSPILTHLEFSSCFLLTDFLSRFCLVLYSFDNI